MRALNGLQDAAINPEMKRVIGEVRESLEGGRELSQALARHPLVFSPFYLSMVRVGEATGLLDTNWVAADAIANWSPAASAQVVAPERLMSSLVSTNTADAVSVSFCCFFAAEVTSMLISCSIPRSARSVGVSVA